MARPERHDVDYFPFYIKDGRTLFILEAKYGCKGTGFFTNVMRFLCSTPDHHFSIQEDTDRLYFFSKTKCDETSGADMLDIMSKTRKIHTHLWVSSAVIVSEALLESLKDAYRKRKNLIITIEEIAKKYVSTGVEAVSGGGNGINAGNKPQRKLKETKGKKTKEKPSPYLGDLSSKITELAKQLARLSLAYPKNGHKNFNINGLVQELVNKKIHPQAIHVALSSLAKRWTFTGKNEVKNPRGYVWTIINTTSGNYYEREHIVKSQQFKNLEMPGELLRGEE